MGCWTRPIWSSLIPQAPAEEVLYPSLIAGYQPDWLEQAEALTLIEHYPGVGGRTGRDTFDLVTFTIWRPNIKLG